MFTRSRPLALAKKEGWPAFVTMRRNPCKQCSGFDADVLDGGSDLSPLLAPFVTVRETTMRDIDQRILPFADGDRWKCEVTYKEPGR
jgi:hypothetical protein